MINRLRHWLRFNLAYLGSPPWDTGITPPEVEQYIAIAKVGRALDLGCGTGTNLLRLAQAGWDVTGVEFAPKAVLVARRRLHKAGYSGSVILGDVGDASILQPPYDLVLDIGCYHGLDASTRARYRANLPTILTDAGTFLLYFHLKIEPEARVGISEEELILIASLFKAVHRQDSEDRFGRKACWLNGTGVVDA